MDSQNRGAPRQGQQGGFLGEALPSLSLGGIESWGGVRHSCGIFPQDPPNVQQLTLCLALPALPIRSEKQGAQACFCPPPPSQVKLGEGSLVMQRG